MPEYVKASYTVETAGVMAVVFFVVMIVINRTFLMGGETVGNFQIHQMVERERHMTENIHMGEISRRGEGEGWSLEITASVFRPENDLRMWSLGEDLS